MLKHKIYIVFGANIWTCAHKNAISLLQKYAHIKKYNIINKCTFQWIFFYNDLKHICLDYRYKFWLSRPENDEACGQKNKLVI